MRIARGTWVIAQCRPCTYKYTLTTVIISSSTLARTLAPPLALDDAGDKALHCRNLSDIVFTPIADIVLFAVAVGVFHRQVRARRTELLGIISHFRLAVPSVVNKTSFYSPFWSHGSVTFYHKKFIFTQVRSLNLHLITCLAYSLVLNKVVRFLTSTDLWVRTNLEPTSYLWVNVFARWGQCLLNWLIFKTFWECIWPLPLPSHLNAVTGTCSWENPSVLIVCIHLQNSYRNT